MQLQDFNYGFVILSPELNYGRILTTVRSIRAHCDDVPIICSAIKESRVKDVKPIEALCPLVRGKDHFTSLINAGIRHGHKEWNIIVCEGAIIHKGMIIRYTHVVDNPKDIIFPIVPTYNAEGYPVALNNTFYDCTLNGLMIHQKTFKEIGNLTDNPMEISRVMWANDAINKGCRFKAILGVRI